jgi:2-octaprenyl-3-methyl-6-methoxy-1,4-benzoquinol hydroxylase
VVAVAGDSRALLQRLGAWPDPATAPVQAVRCMRVWDAAGGDELCFDADALGREGLGHIVEHGLLADRLWTAVQRHAGIELRCPQQLQDIAQSPDGVELGLSDGSRLQARLLIGADGAGSRVRELAGVKVSDRDYHQRGLVAYVSTSRPHEDTCWQRFLPGGPLAFLPCADGRSSIVWTLAEAEAGRLLQCDDRQFCAELTRALDARLGEVTDVSIRRAFPLRRRLADGMLHGRIALLGDAAHVVHPLAGQGMNLGLRDATALAESIADARALDRDWLAPHRLAKWARNRGSENATAAYAFEAINAIFSSDSVLPTLLRGHLLGIAGKLPPLSRFLWQRASGG